MKRREFITLLGGAATTWPLAVSAQKKGNPWLIGFLSPRSVSDRTFIDDFRLGMRDLGYVERKDFVIEARYGDGEYRRLAAMAQELVKLNVDKLAVNLKTAKALGITLPPGILALADEVLE
jgi:putative ABC transport system substrate-binding protein